MTEIYLPYTKEINSDQLRDELNGVSVVLVGDKLRFVGDVTEEQAKKALEAHTPIIEPEPTIEDKLARAGLSVADLKVALGL
jgi:hypothetical protein